MNKISHSHPITVGAVMLLLATGDLATANDGDRLSCLVDDSDDRFELYPDQLSYRGHNFDHYQLIDGLTVVVVNRRTGKFNRLSNLNLLPHSTLDPSRAAEPIQFFTGRCVRKSN
jgi:hypothetical protein